MQQLRLTSFFGLGNTQSIPCGQCLDYARFHSKIMRPMLKSLRPWPGLVYICLFCLQLRRGCFFMPGSGRKKSGQLKICPNNLNVTLERQKVNDKCPRLTTICVLHKNIMVYLCSIGNRHYALQVLYYHQGKGDTRCTDKQKRA